jgi:hypothetical protein
MSLNYVEALASDFESRFGTSRPADLLKPSIRNRLFAGAEAK